MSDALLQIQSVRQAFPKPDGEDMLVLDDINFSLADGQIVGLLGRSGSGKSTILRLDESFSALDVLTAETLRTDFLDLWIEGKLPIKGVILVTHNIEEAVLMCDRILVFSRDPGHIVEEIKVDLPQPRSRLDAEFRDLVERSYVALTARPAESPPRAAPERPYGSGIVMVLPRVSANALAGLIEAVAGAPYNGKADLPVIASALQMEVDDLFPIAETLQLMRFADIEGGDIKLTEDGKQFAGAGVDDRKKLFQRQLFAHVPLAAHIQRVLQELSLIHISEPTRRT